MMKKLKKALSLALTFALSLALAAPAFAADGEGVWNLVVHGKPDEEVVVPGAATYTLRDVEFELGTHYLTKAEETFDYVANDVMTLRWDDTLDITVRVSGDLSISAFSDPDGDGIYDRRVAGYSSADGDIVIAPIPGADPVQLESSMIYTSFSLMSDGGFWGPAARWEQKDDDGDGWADLTLTGDYLFRNFGPETFVSIFIKDDVWGFEYDRGWFVYLTDGDQPSAPSTPAEPEQPSGSADSSSISVTVGGTAVMWTDAAPFIDANSRTMVPLRAVADAMSLTVNWDGEAREAAFTDGSKTICFPIDSTSARTSDGGDVQMDTAAVIANERTYAPIRYLAEFFGYTVGWDGATQTVSLTK